MSQNARRYPTVLITDETLRDGFQIERPGITIEEKLQVARMLVDAGLRRIVVGAFVNPKWSPQMADTAELVTRLPRVDGVQYLAIALNERGRQQAREMSPPLATDLQPTTHLHLCDVFLMRNTNRTVAQQEAQWRLPIEQAVARGVKRATIGLSAPWGSNWRGGFSHEQRMAALIKQWDAWHAAGIEVTRVHFADPMSWNRPDAVAEDLRAIRDRWPTINEFHLHLHNGRGMAPLSVWEALRFLGPDDLLMVDSAIGGIGGCPYNGSGQATGMIPTEDLVQLLQMLGVDTGMDLGKLIEITHHVSALLGRHLDGRVHQAGAFEPLFDENLPVVYTLDEALHFRLGSGVVKSDFRPWLRKA